ncbi:hypothetical protein TRICI_005850 [Trichomonascus ciferrii]|uniref:Cullin family profile domain-containing protein n=1 Tax=Trichomonascus ciferrii TaxID=44093 RepID=A0A642UP20_9ASCO|nr:hypothetical protein TRICI_005850 [Trichomonascus ciferrii]
MSNTRRARIRPPKRNFSSQAVDFESAWSKLSLAINQIHEKNASKLSFEELYRTAYNLVLYKFSKKLYESVQDEVRGHLERIVQTELDPLISGGSSNPTQTLKELDRIWNDHCLCMRLISDILMYLDRVYSKETHMPLIYDAGLTIFRDAVIRSSSVPVGEHVYQLIISEVQKEREGEIIDRIAIKQVVNMLQSLPESRIEGESIYVTDFEPLLEKATETFYDNAASQLLQENNDASVYIKKSQTWLDEEMDRCTMYLSESTTWPRLSRIIDRVVISDRIRDVMVMPHTGFTSWIDNDRYDELALVFKLVTRISSEHEVIRDMLKDKVLESGGEINQVATHSAELAKEAKQQKKTKDKNSQSSLSSPTSISVKWVESVLEMKDKYDRFSKRCFGENRGIQTTVENAFSRFVNANAKVAEFLSLFIDDHLKKSLKGKTEEEVEEVLDKAIVLFRFVEDKDKFERLYKNHLAKRLLNGKSVSEDAERAMVGKIKMEVGTAFTSKMEGMFKDMRISKDLMNDFKAAKTAGTVGCPVEVNVNVVTATHWPQSIANSEAKCIFPTDIETSKKAFADFYLSRHNGRKLLWNPNMGTADVKVRFKKRVHEVNMPTFAMVILLLFNDLAEDESLSYEEIRDATAIPENELKRNLQSIAVAPKTRLLRKEPMSKEVSLTDRFYFNEDFESNMARIKVLAVSAGKSENDEENKKILQDVNRSRQYETEAAIVRIMKARKSMEHANLIAEVTRQLSSRFKPDPAMIKPRIDALLEREYLERDADSRNVYNYLA